MGFPNLPGIPPLQAGTVATSVAVTTVLSSPLVDNLLNSLKPSWGIYSNDGKTKVIKPDTFLSIDYNTESNLPMFPLEKGAFDTYNKVATPYTATVRVSKGSTLGFGGATSDLKGFLDTLESIQGDTNLYAIVTPDATYLDANMKGYTYKREMNNGAVMILANLNFVQVMTAQKLVSTATATLVPPNPTATVPSAQAQINNGACQAIPLLATPSTLLGGFQ
jgi:hypothetical protein